MAQDASLGFVAEPAGQRSVLYDVDVAVAGAGLCCTFAAIAAGRCGARTLLIERFGSLGGNIGPGMIVNGGLYNEAETTLPGGLAGIPREFVERVEALRVRKGRLYAEEAGIVSYVAYEMMAEAGVEVLLSACASDPIVEEGVVHGLFVECPTGRFAVRAKVTVDGTGTAAIAERAGAPMVPYLEVREAYADYIRPPYLQERHSTYYNDTQLLCVVAGVDLEKFEAFSEEEAHLSDEDRAWGERSGMLANYPPGLISALRQAGESGGFRPVVELEPGVRMSAGRRFLDCDDGNVGLQITCTGAADAGDAVQTSRIEAAMRAQAFRAVAFYRKHAPGFEKAYLLTVSQFLGWRGGPHIEGEHTITPEESFAGVMHDDVLYRNIHEHGHGGAASGFDVPYRAILPKGVDGLLVGGRGAAYYRRGHDPSGMRARPSMMVFGQCIGTAAAVAALDGATTRSVDVRKVQKRLVEEGIFLGEAERLKALGVSCGGEEGNGGI